METDIFTVLKKYFQLLDDNIKLINLEKKYNIILTFSNDLKIFISTINKEWWYLNNKGYLYKSKYCRIWYLWENNLWFNNKTIKLLYYFILNIEKKWINSIKYLFLNKTEYTKYNFLCNIDKKRIIFEIERKLWEIEVELFFIDYINFSIKFIAYFIDNNWNKKIIILNQDIFGKSFYKNFNIINNNIKILNKKKFNRWLRKVDKIIININDFNFNFFLYDYIENLWVANKVSDHLLNSLINFNVVNIKKDNYYIWLIQTDTNVTNFLKLNDSEYFILDYSSIVSSYLIIQPILVFIYNWKNISDFEYILNYYLLNIKWLYLDIIWILNKDINYNIYIKETDLSLNIKKIILKNEIEEVLNKYYVKYKKYYEWK